MKEMRFNTVYSGNNCHANSDQNSKIKIRDTAALLKSACFMTVIFRELELEVQLLLLSTRTRTEFVRTVTRTKLLCPN